MWPVPIRITTNVDECIRARVLAGLNQRQAAERIGITAKYMSLIEAGSGGGPSPAVLKRMAEVYGVPMDTLIVIDQPGEAIAS